MIHCEDSVLWLDNQFVNCDFIDKRFFEDKITVYEVFRVINGIPLFLDDHLMRLSRSLAQIGITSDFSLVINNLVEVISQFISLAKIKSGNIEIALVFNKDLNALVHNLVYAIPFHYPSEEQYESGVSTMFYFAARENPSAKVKDQSLREAADIIISKRKLFEVVLVDKYGRVTEGSRTNIFFVKGDTLFTAPEKMVLNGITRAKVFDICNRQGIVIKETPIAYDQIGSMDGAFLTGTSPKILPIKLLEDTVYRCNIDLVKSITVEYERMIKHCTISFTNKIN